MDIDAIVWGFFDLVSEYLSDIGTELKGVDWCRCLSRITLQSGSHETLWEEEGRYPERVGHALMEPLAEELHSRYQVWHPGAEWL